MIADIAGSAVMFSLLVAMLVPLMLGLVAYAWRGSIYVFVIGYAAGALAMFFAWPALVAGLG